MSIMKKVLYVIQRYRPAHLTGSEKVIDVFATTLARQAGYQSLVLTGDTEYIAGIWHPGVKRYPKTQTLEKVHIHRLQTNWFVGSSSSVLHRIFPVLNRVTQGQMAFEGFGPHFMHLEKTITSLKPDIIHTGPMPLYHVYATWKVARKHNIPLVITPMMHFDVEEFHNPLIYQILQSVAQVTVFTQYEKDQLVAKGVLADKITVIPATYISEEDFTHGDGQRFRQQYKLTDEPIALFMGTKAFDKGATHLLQVWSEVRSAVPTAHLVFAGLPTTAWQKELERLAPEGVINLDYISGEAKHDLFAASTTLAVPSRTESFGIVIPEAWAKGKPVIGGATGAAQELIDNDKNGYTVEFGDVKTLARSLIALLSNPVKAKAMGEAGRSKAKQFTEAAFTQQMLKVYDKI